MGGSVVLEKKFRFKDYAVQLFVLILKAIK
jgi:hypothetical protein